jgi:hypothetical protein
MKMQHIEVRKVSADYLRNEPCDLCGRPKAVTKRCLVLFDCGYMGELNVCTWDLRSLEYRGKKLEAPRRNHFHMVDEKSKTWFNLDEVFTWIRTQ